MKLKESASQTAGPYVHIGLTPNFSGIPGIYARDLGDEMLSSKTKGERITITVIHRGDRPIQVGSHYPFEQTNAALELDRALAKDHHLDIPAGTAVRFEPGETRTVTLVANAETAPTPSLNPRQLAAQFERASGKLPENLPR